MNKQSDIFIKKNFRNKKERVIKESTSAHDDPIKNHYFADSHREQQETHICERTNNIHRIENDDTRCDDDSVIDDHQYMKILENEWKQLRMKVVEMKQQKSTCLMKIEGLMKEHNLLQQRKEKMKQVNSTLYEQQQQQQPAIISTTTTSTTITCDIIA